MEFIVPRNLISRKHYIQKWSLLARVYGVIPFQRNTLWILIIFETVDYARMWSKLRWLEGIISET